MKESTLLLTTREREGLPGFVRVVGYLDDQSEARAALRDMSRYGLLWLEPASEIYYFEAEDLAAIAEFVKGGGGFLVTGGLGEGFLFRTMLEEMLPAKAIFQEDRRPQMNVRDIKQFADSVWPGSGEIVIDEKNSPLIRGTGLKSGMKLSGSYVSLAKPGAHVVARFDMYESVQSRLDLEPSLMPLILTWVWYGGRTIHVAADVEMFPADVDVGKFISNVVKFVEKKPTRHEMFADRLAYYRGMMVKFHERLESLAGTGVEPDKEDFDSLRGSITSIVDSVQNHSETPLETLHELGDGVERWERLLEGMEAELFQSAFEAFMAFHSELTQAEIDGVFDENSLEWLRYRGELAKLSFNAKAYFEAGNQYRALCRVISDARESQPHTGQP